MADQLPTSLDYFRHEITPSGRHATAGPKERVRGGRGKPTTSGLIRGDTPEGAP